MIDIPMPPTFCEVSKNFAYEVMKSVQNKDTNLITGSYNAYTGDTGKSVLNRAKENYAQEKPLTPEQFSIQIFNECKAIHK